MDVGILLSIVGIILGIVGLLVAAYFGVRSMFQSSDMEALQRAVRANNQAMYNILWRIANQSNVLLRRDDLTVETKQFATGVNEATIAARSSLIAFSREHAQFIPSFELAWEPREFALEERSRPFWRRVFFLTEPTRLPLAPATGATPIGNTNGKSTSGTE